MREIKFRTYGGNWSKEPKKRMIYCGKITDSDFYRPQSDDVVYMQWTGLKDKNRTDIYEGDILECVQKTKGHVFFHDGAFRLSSDQCELDLDAITTFDDLSKDLIEDNFLEVIGNIYENNSTK